MKKLIIIVLLVALVLIIAGCGNKRILEFEYVFDYAIVRMPDGEVVTIEIDKWTDYEGEQLQIWGKDGRIYLVSSINTVFIKEAQNDRRTNP